MPPNTCDPASAADGSEENLAVLIEQVETRMRRDPAFDIEVFCAEHPAEADQIRSVWPTLQAMADLGHGSGPVQLTTAPGKATKSLGDYRIIRELGRGGMGVVYEAEQLSLGRNVALKVLPFASMLDERQRTRFRNEARAAATLDHPNIVSVYGTGEERGVHYYAMQLIAGCSLADAIGALRRRGGPADVSGSPAGDASQALAKTLETDEVDGGSPSVSTLRSGVVLVDPSDAASSSTLSREYAADQRRYFRTVARLGVRIAEGLEHAHLQGVIHRDIKPANIMLDAVGVAYLTDFGLARIQTDTAMTMTGDLIGTLRYMSPEQALAKRVVVDQRTDIYSLGATLYELLTLLPAYDGADRQELLHQIAFEEPKLPTRINRNIPPDLEVVVLKAMTKNPGERYVSAQELADDLQRFLDSRPLMARRPSLASVAAKWLRRHRAIVVTACFSLAAALLIGVLLVSRAYYREREQRRAADSATARAVSARTVATRRLREAEAARAAERQARVTAEELRVEAQRQREQYYRLLYDTEVRLLDLQARMGVRHFAADGLPNFLPTNDRPDIRSWEWYYLVSQRQFPDQILEPAGHGPRAGLICCSDDGRYVAAVSEEQLSTAVRTWDSQTGELLREFYPANGCCSWSPNGEMLAIGCSRDVFLWDRKSDAIRLLWTNTIGEPKVLKFSRSGEQLACVITNGRMVVLDVEAGTARHEFALESSSTNRVAWGTETDLATVHPTGGFLSVWNLKLPKAPPRKWPANVGGGGIDWSPNGRLIAVNHQEKGVVLLAAETLEEQSSWTRAHSFQFSSDSRHLALGNDDGHSLIDVQKHERVSHQPVTHIRSWDAKLVRGFRYQPGTIESIRIERQEKLGPLSVSTGLTKATGLQWVDNHRVRVAGHEGGQRVVSVIDYRTGKAVLSTAPIRDEMTVLSTSLTMTARLEDDGRQSRIVVNDVHTGTTRQVIPLEGMESTDIIELLWTRGDEAVVLAKKADGKLRLQGFPPDSSSPDFELELTENGSRADRIVLVYDRLDRRVFVASRRRPSYISSYDTSTGDLQWTAKHDGWKASVAISPNGERIASIFGHLGIVDVESGRQVLKTAVQVEVGGSQPPPAWHPDGTRLAYSSRNQLHVIDAINGQVVLQLESSGGFARWSPSGELLAQLSPGGQLSIWDAGPGYEREIDRSTLTGEAVAVDSQLFEVNPTEAIDYLLTGLQQNPSDASMNFALAMQYRKLSQLDLAAEQIEKATTRSPNRGVYWELRREIEIGRQQWTEAADAGERLIQLIDMPRGRIPHLIRQAQIHLAAEQIDHAREVSNRLMTLMRGLPSKPARYEIERCVLLAAISPDAFVNLREVYGLAEVNRAEFPWATLYAVERAFLRFRLGEVAPALEELHSIHNRIQVEGEQPTNTDPRAAAPFLSWMITIAEATQGNRDAARRWYEESDALMKDYLDTHPFSDAAIYLPLLRQEATSLANSSELR